VSVRATIRTDTLETPAGLRSTVLRRVAVSDDPRLVVPLLVVAALAIYLYGIGWGLPNGNETWAADAIKPGTPLSIAHRALGGWNSGWFWFKYPLGHVFVLCAVYAPYMAYLRLAGQLGTPTSAYPHGFSDPETALATLALLGRSVSALMGAGTVALVYLTARTLFGRLAGVVAAAVAAFAYPVVYYAHTTNVEIPYLFWTALALYAGVRLVTGGAPRWFWVLGAAAAMAVSTKELVVGFVLALPLVVVLVQWVRGGRGWRLPAGALGGLAAAVAVFVMANNIVGNPLGFWHRVQLLTHTLDPAVRELYAPYFFPIELDATRGLGVEVAHARTIARHVVTSLGWPTTLLALGGFVVAVRTRPLAAALLAIPGVAFYLVGLRAMMSPSLRYVLPLTMLGAVFVGAGAAAALGPGRARWLRGVLVAAALVHCVVYGWDVNRMLVGDGRYDAEGWLARLPAGAEVEVYQRPTYLPRFPDGVRVTRVPFDEIRVEAFARRRPDYVVLSSAGLSGVTVRYNADWQGTEAPAEDLVPARPSESGRVMSYVHPGNQAFLAALRDGSLGYRPLARFGVTPWIDRPHIQSLNPTIWIYGVREAPTEAPTP
jgi:4-amino-4-deoxy-L-arabinose transferase-like glycosyltransferase